MNYPRIGEIDRKIIRRFAEKVEMSEGCWEWQATKDRNGYGQMYVDGRTHVASRISFAIFWGGIPEGLQVDHLCRNKSCVRPDHLELVTQRENLERMFQVLRTRSHCKNGHEWADGNEYFTPKGKRLCRSCQKASKDAYLARKKDLPGDNNNSEVNE